MLRKGFTLAEVLITLAIIGIVAAMTIPTLINNYQKQVTVTRLKKAYSQLAQAIKLSEVTNGEVKYWNLDAPAEEFLDLYIAPYMKNVEKLTTADLHAKVKYKFLDGTYISNGTVEGASLKLSDGTIVMVDGWSPGDNHLRTLYIDINGYSQPNMLGKDLFAFIIRNSGKFAPYGSGIQDRKIFLSHENAQTCNVNSSSSGMSCSALIFLDGWKISDDYPW